MSEVDNLVIGSDRIEERSDMGDKDSGVWAYWMAQDKIAEKEERRWVKKAREVVKRYRDERPEAYQDTHKVNILWSNVQTLIPTLYARTPTADVERRFHDQDDVGRVASEILQRSIEFQLEAFDFDDVMESVVQDRLLPGRGVARIIYIPHFGEVIKGDDADMNDPGMEGGVVDNEGDEGSAIPSDQEDNQSESETPKAEQLREVVYEEVMATYTFWEDYREGQARKWVEVPWNRFRSYLTRDELVERFGKKKGNLVNLDYSPRPASASEYTRDEPPADLFKKAQVWEIWDKAQREVIWIAPGTPDLVLDKVEDPLRLPGFFPNPDPLFATMTNDKRIPIPDFIEYQDQAREMDRLTGRIDRLTRALKVSGVYAGDEKQTLQQLLDEGTENRLIPVADWAAMQDKGGLKGCIEWVPIEQIAMTLIQLYNARDRVKALLYEITGIGDIMRGQSDPTETAQAQMIKASYSQRRIAPQQRAVAKFARDIIRLMGSCIAEHFSAKTISMISGYPKVIPVPQLPPMPPQMIPDPSAGQQTPMNTPPGVQPGMPMQPQQPQMVPNPVFMQWQKSQQAQQLVIQQNQEAQQQFDQAIALLRQNAMRQFRIDIEADSTIAADEQAEKNSRVEFLQQMVPLLEQSFNIAQGNPPIAELAKQITLFAVRGFKVGRSMEQTFEKAFDALAQMPPQPPKGGKSGSNVDSPADLALRDKEAMLRAQTAQQQASINAAKVSGELQIDRERLAMESAHGAAKIGLDAQHLQDQKEIQTARELKLAASSAGGLV